jgi:transposase
MIDPEDDPKTSRRRIELLIGDPQRRDWTPAEKGRIVAESLAPGACISEVARRYDLRPQQLFKWRHEAKKGLLVLPDLGSAMTSGEQSPAFVPVVMDGDGASSSPLPQAPVKNKRAASQTVEINLSGAIVRVVAGIEMDFLTDVLRAVRASA